MLHLICMFHVVPHLDFTPVEMRCLHILIITLWKLSLASRNTQEVLDLLRPPWYPIGYYLELSSSLA